MFHHDQWSVERYGVKKITDETIIHIDTKFIIFISL